MTMRRFRTTLRQSSVARALLSPLTTSYGRMWDIAAIGKDGARWWMNGAKSDEAFEATGRRDAELLARFVTPESRVLDLGCGIGRVAKHLAPHCASICAVDVSNRMLGRARSYLHDISNVSLQRVNGRDLHDFPDGAFDFAYAIGVFHHLEREDMMRYLAELVRVLRPGGRAYLQFLNLEVEHLAAEFLDYAMGSRALQIARRRYTTEAEVRTYAALAGFNGTYIWQDGDWLLMLTATPSTAAEPVMPGELA